MYIPRKLSESLNELLSHGKVLILYGARRVGKTTLIENYVQSLPDNEKVLFVNGDDIVIRQYLESQSISKLRDFVGDHTTLIVDEGQYIKNIGLNLKLIIDHIPNLKVIATGSSSFDLAKDIGEPLTGRKIVLNLLPVAQLELAQIEKVHERDANLEARLIFGSYPEVITTKSNSFRQDYLRELVSSYLFKDILVFEGIRQSDKIARLLQLIAFQVGKQVSFNEFGTKLEMSKNTVEKYLDLLEKVFVIFKRSGFSRNLRKEITKNHRYYFFDNGIRNAIIGNFNPLDLRDDVGQLWENYIISERMKKNEYSRSITDSYFWRTYDKKEIDLVEEKGGKLFAYEIKWQSGSIKAPTDWITKYPGSEFDIISRENYLDFIG